MCVEEVVVAQLVERSLPIPEVRGSNPVIGKNYLYIEHLFTVNCVLKRRKIKKKRPGMAHFKKRNCCVHQNMLENEFKNNDH